MLNKVRQRIAAKLAPSAPSTPSTGERAGTDSGHPAAASANVPAAEPAPAPPAQQPASTTPDRPATATDDRNRQAYERVWVQLLDDCRNIVFPGMSRDRYDWASAQEVTRTLEHLRDWLLSEQSPQEQVSPSEGHAAPGEEAPETEPPAPTPPPGGVSEPQAALPAETLQQASTPSQSLTPAAQPKAADATWSDRLKRLNDKLTERLNS